MIIKLLIHLGLALTPFVIFRGMYQSVPKEIVGFGLALAISLLALYYGSLKKVENYWLLLFVGFAYISICFAPNYTDFIITWFHDNNQFTMLPRRPIAHMWMYKAFSHILVYSLLMITVASVDFEPFEVRRLLLVMMICGLLMSLYIFIQWAKLDQFFDFINIQLNPDLPNLDKPELGGFLGQSTVVAPFIVMLIPIALFLRRYIAGAIMITAVILLQSKVALVAMALGIVAYFLLSRRKYHKVIGVGIIAVLIIGGSFYITVKHDFKNLPRIVELESNGRFEAWREIWNDFKAPVGGPIDGKKYTVTGFGPGSFEYVFSIRHDNKWWQAHNDPLELMYNFGIGGFLLAAMALWVMVLKVFSNWDDLSFAIFTAFLALLFCSFGTFPFQIAPNIFYCSVFIGLLYNIRLSGGYNEQKI